MWVQWLGWLAHTPTHVRFYRLMIEKMYRTKLLKTHQKRRETKWKLAFSPHSWGGKSLKRNEQHKVGLWDFWNFMNPTVKWIAVNQHNQKNLGCNTTQTIKFNQNVGEKNLFRIIIPRYYHTEKHFNFSKFFKPSFIYSAVSLARFSKACSQTEA